MHTLRRQSNKKLGEKVLEVEGKHNTLKHEHKQTKVVYNNLLNNHMDLIEDNKVTQAKYKEVHKKHQKVHHELTITAEKYYHFFTICREK